MEFVTLISFSCLLCPRQAENQSTTLKSLLLIDVIGTRCQCVPLWVGHRSTISLSSPMPMKWSYAMSTITVRLSCSVRHTTVRKVQSPVPSSPLMRILWSAPAQMAWLSHRYDQIILFLHILPLLSLLVMLFVQQQLLLIKTQLLKRLQQWRRKGQA